jgi:Fe-S-cluster containining protein
MAVIYAEVDAEIAAASPRCDRSGACCRFGSYGHRLYATRAEAIVFALRQAPPSGAITDDVCPYQVDGLCTAREGRPLGCRVFFCDPGWKGKGEALTERMLRRIGALSERLGVEREYRPFLAHLRDLATFKGESSWRS